MNNSESEQFRLVDRLVEQHVQQRSERIDASRLLGRIRTDWLAGSGQNSPIAVRRGHDARTSGGAHWRSRSFVWAAAAVLAILVAFIGGRSITPQTANAAVILREVHSAHSQDVDRCYRVQFAPDPQYWDGTEPLKGPSDSILWTRGEQFCSDVRIGTIRLAIGRDAEGTLWASPSRSKGIQFSDRLKDVPEAIAFACAVNSMSLPTLVEDVLADFDLQGQGPSSHGGDETNLIWAKLKPGRSHWLLSAALLEVDAATDAIVRLVLWTVEEGKPKGTVTFTLIDSDTFSEERYRLRSHVDDDAVIERHDLGKPAAKSDGPAP